MIFRVYRLEHRVLAHSNNRARDLRASRDEWKEEMNRSI